MPRSAACDTGDDTPTGGRLHHAAQVLGPGPFCLALWRRRGRHRPRSPARRPRRARGRRDHDRGPAAPAVRRRPAQRRRSGPRLQREAAYRSTGSTAASSASSPSVLDLLGPDSVLEREPLERLAAAGRPARLSPRGLLGLHGHLQGRRSPQRPVDARAPLRGSGGADAPVRPPPRSVLVTGAHGLLGAWLTVALLDAGARRGRPSAATEQPPSTLELLGRRRRGPHRARRHLRGGPRGARARRVRGRRACSTSPLRPLVGDRQRVPRARPLRPTSAGPGCCWRRVGHAASHSVIVASSDKAYGRPGRPALPRGLTALAADVSLRRLQGRRRPHRPLLLAHVRPAGGGHPTRQPLRRRRHQPQLAWCPRRSARRWPAALRSSAPTARPSATSSTSRTPPPRTWRSGARSLAGQRRRRGLQRGRRESAPCRATSWR